MQDGIRRWMTPEGTFRILAAHSTALVNEATRLAGCAPEVVDPYGRLLTGAALMQLAQAPVDRVQCSLRHDGGAGTLLADIWPGPEVRGRVARPDPGPGPVLGRTGTIEVSRVPAHGGRLYQSVVPVHAGNLCEALQQYVLESEQVLTFFSMAVVQGAGGQVVRAGGLLVQALPGAKHEHLAEITRCLEKALFADLVHAGDEPYAAVDALFHSLSLHMVGELPLVYRCRCSRDRAIAAVHALGAEVLEEIRRGQTTEQVHCEFCQTTYTVTAAEL
jgi:molecular chaperone Hsp33